MKAIICGTTMSGKNHLQRELSRHFYPAVSHTTRPKRPKEVEGIDYYFVDDDAFESIVDEGKFLEVAKHPDGKGAYYKYGVTKEEWDRSDLIILNREGLRSIEDKVDPNGLIVIYLEMSLLSLIQRLGELYPLDSGNQMNDYIKRYIEEVEGWNDFFDNKESSVQILKPQCTINGYGFGYPTLKQINPIGEYVDPSVLHHLGEALFRPSDGFGFKNTRS